MTEYSSINESNNQLYKKSLWDTAKGLQAVDGLKTSDYLDTVAEKNINNDLSYEEVLEKLYTYYGTNANVNYSNRQADIVATRIVQYLNGLTFNYGIAGIMGIHEFLFSNELGALEAGRFRKGNVYKAEFVLNGDTVNYGDFHSNRIALDILFSSEKRYEYSYPMTEDDIKHLAEFVSELWQIHPFAEGNTRTTAVYIIMYLRTKGFEINNDMFKEYSDYFRNALVRSVYENLKIGVRPNFEYLEKFFKNLLLNTSYELNSEVLKLPFNKEYAKEVAKKITSITGKNVSDEELWTLMNDKNVRVRQTAKEEIVARVNYSERINELDELAANPITDVTDEIVVEPNSPNDNVE